MLLENWKTTSQSSFASVRVANHAALPAETRVPGCDALGSAEAGCLCCHALSSPETLKPLGGGDALRASALKALDRKALGGGDALRASALKALDRKALGGDALRASALKALD